MAHNTTDAIAEAVSVDRTKLVELRNRFEAAVTLLGDFKYALEPRKDGRSADDICRELLSDASDLLGWVNSIICPEDPRSGQLALFCLLRRIDEHSEGTIKWKNQTFSNAISVVHFFIAAPFFLPKSLKPVEKVRRVAAQFTHAELGQWHARIRLELGHMLRALPVSQPSPAVPKRPPGRPLRYQGPEDEKIFQELCRGLKPKQVSLMHDVDIDHVRGLQKAMNERERSKTRRNSAQKTPVKSYRGF